MSLHMKTVFCTLKRELTSVILVFLSFIPLFFMGSLLDILLTFSYAHVENGETSLPVFSQWVHDLIAGYRFLPQEIMACFWLLMVLCFMFNILTARDQQQFRIRFIYSFLFTWVLAITAAAFIAFACVIPFDLLLARVTENGVFGTLIRAVLLCELVLIVILPIGLPIWKKTRTTQQDPPNVK